VVQQKAAALAAALAAAAKSGPGGSSLLPKSFVYTFVDAAAVRGSNAGPNGQLLSTFMANNCQVSKGPQIASTAA